MKKIRLAALVLGLSLMLSACGTASAPTQSTTSAGTSSSAAQGRVVEPSGLSQTLDNFTDGELSVSFQVSDLDNSDDRSTLTVTAYAYALYDSEEIDALSDGDTLVVDGNEIAVQSVTDSDGYLSINGSEENGGITLAPGEDGTYFVVDMDDAKDYQELGSLTLPLADDCQITDDSDPEAPGKVLSLTDFAALTESDGNFVPNNTTIVVKDSVITSIHRFYMP